jgi:hypothetical protein
MVNKKPVGLKIAQPTLDMVEELQQWLNAPSATWVWETAIIRMHTEEAMKRRQRTETKTHGAPEPSTDPAVERALTQLKQAKTEEQIQKIIASLPESVLSTLAGNVDVTSLSDEELEDILGGDDAQGVTR